MNVAFPGNTNLFLFRSVNKILMFSGMLPENNKMLLTKHENKQQEGIKNIIQP